MENLITGIIIKQQAEKSKNFYMHVSTGSKLVMSSFAFEANTVPEIKENVSKIIKEYGMNEKYTMGVTVSKKIQITLDSNNK